MRLAARGHHIRWRALARSSTTTSSIIGAGISGIAAGVELQRSCPDKTFAILEMRDDLGGTWDLFRYPGIRSDSDMYTLGFGFKPWTDEKVMASGAAIQAYLRETVDEFGLGGHMRFGTRLVSASWSSGEKRWTLTVATDGGSSTLTCGFLYLGTGLYSHREASTRRCRGRQSSRAPSSTLRTGPRTWTTPASGSPSSARVPPRSR